MTVMLMMGNLRVSWCIYCLIGKGKVSWVCWYCISYYAIYLPHSSAGATKSQVITCRNSSFIWFTTTSTQGSYILVVYVYTYFVLIIIIIFLLLILGIKLLWWESICERKAWRYLYSYVCVHVCMSACVQVCMCAHVCVYMYVCVNIVYTMCTCVQCMCACVYTYMCL